MDVRQKKHAKKPLPCIWLMTDPRLDGELFAAVQRLRAGSGVILRHYHLDPGARRTLFLTIRKICRRRGHELFLAGDERTALRWGADGFHNRDAPRGHSRAFLRSAPVHDAREITKAKRNRADMLLLSPLFATASHTGKRPLGPLQFNRLAALARSGAIIAVGGMNARKAALLGKQHQNGWAGIDAFKKRKAGR